MPDLLDSPSDPVPFDLRDATFDGYGIYRYDLFRAWHEEWERFPSMYFVLLNPSDADAIVNDPTARRCVGFAKTCGFRSLHIVNLYALKATRPVHLWEHIDPIGPENDGYLRAALERATSLGGVVVAGWGTNAKDERVEQFRGMARMVGASVWSLGVNQGGSPKHPLYVRADRALERWC